MSAPGGGLDPIPPPNRKGETMQNTVDQAHGPVPRTLADIIEDAPSADLADLLAGDDHGAARRSGAILSKII